MAVDEFEIKQVYGNSNLDEGNSSRSLVFKISKRINKDSKQQTTCSKVTSNNSILKEEQSHLTSEPCLSSEPNLEENCIIKHAIEAGAAGHIACSKKAVGQVAENSGPNLRRASKRIILRVRKPNFQVNDITSTGKKTKHSASETTKQGSNYVKMGKRKGYRKAFSAGNLKSELIRRGRGRPRKINREQSLEKMEKIVSIKGSKPPKKSLTVINPADSSSVWTLVPKEFVNSEFFKSHIMKLQQRAPRGRRPKKTTTASHASVISQIPFTDLEKIKVQYPQMSPITTKTAIQQDPVPLSTHTSRPIVIHFNKTQKNGFSEMETNWPVLKQINLPNQQQVEVFPSKELQFTFCMQQNNENGAALGCVYGQSQVNLKRNEYLIRDALYGRKQINEECNSLSNLQYGLQSYTLKSQEHKMEQRNDFVLQNFREERALESPPKMGGSNLSYRQVIADAIRILYDEESVLGYV